MNSNDLTLVTELKRGTSSVGDGRYIYVLRGTDGKFLIRPYDRSVSDPSCNQLYEKARYAANWRGTRYLHVRHSQLNGGWDPIYAGGEIKIWGGKITVLNNESGHFKAQDVLIEHAVNTLKAYKVPVSPQLKWGSFQEYSAALSSTECRQLLR